MDDFQTNDLLNIAKQRNQEEVESQLAQDAMRNTSSKLNLWLSSLGTWMVATGKKLQTRHASSLQINLEFPKGKPRKARAH